MIVHVLVEGPSERAFVEGWAPRAFRGHTFIAHPHQGKGALPSKKAKSVSAKGKSAAKGTSPATTRTGLLDLLPATLSAYAAAKTAADDAFLVLVDADDESCLELKKRLVSMVSALRPRPQRLIFRIAVEETEAFYLGDLRALKAAFPDADLGVARCYVPDSVCGTAELFGSIVNDGGLNKVSWAEEMGRRLTTRPAASRSPSFRALHAGITKLLAGAPTPVKPKKKKNWKTRHSAKRKARK